VCCCPDTVHERTTCMYCMMSFMRMMKMVRGTKTQSRTARSMNRSPDMVQGFFWGAMATRRGGAVCEGRRARAIAARGGGGARARSVLVTRARAGVHRGAIARGSGGACRPSVAALIKREGARAECVFHPTARRGSARCAARCAKAAKRPRVSCRVCVVRVLVACECVCVWGSAHARESPRSWHLRPTSAGPARAYADDAGLAFLRLPHARPRLHTYTPPLFANPITPASF
jgi:hypothetical protein